MCLAVMDKLMKIKMRPGHNVQKHFLHGQIYRGEVKDAGETTSAGMWRNALVKALTSKYESITLTADRDSNFTLEQIQDAAHEYYTGDLCVRGNLNIAGHGAAMWARHGPNCTGDYEHGDERNLQQKYWNPRSKEDGKNNWHKGKRGTALSKEDDIVKR